jgi:hypothetical protein
MIEISINTLRRSRYLKEERRERDPRTGSDVLFVVLDVWCGRVVRKQSEAGLALISHASSILSAAGGNS